MFSKIQHKPGFTLIEVLLYVGILSIVATVFGAILVTTTKIQNRESASVEVNNQMNFVLQTIQRLVRESSLIENEAGLETGTLTIRMKDDSKDPTMITLQSDAVQIKEKTGPYIPLTTNKVTVNDLKFKKFANYPGHDTIEVKLQMTYASENPQWQISRTLKSAIARVSAATFDSSVLPGGSFDIGQSGSPWRNGYFSGNIDINQNLTVGSSDGTSGYLQFQRRGAGAPTDACTNAEWGRLYIDTTNNRLYICNGLNRGWDYIPLNN